MQTPRLILSQGQNPGGSIELSEFPFTLGTHTQNTLPIKEADGSEFLLQIKKRGRLFIIESLSGLAFINGERFRNSILENGDKILVGSTELIFQYVPQVDVVGISSLQGDTNSSETVKISYREDFSPDLDLITPLADKMGKQIISFFRPLSIIKRVFDCHEKLLNSSNINDLSQSLLDTLLQILPQIDRTLIFNWSQVRNEFSPSATRSREKKHGPFCLSSKGFDEVIAKKHPCIIHHPQKQVPTRLIFPMIYQGRLLCAIHLECDNKKFSDTQLELARELIQQSAAYFKNIFLNEDIDALMFGSLKAIFATIEAKDTYTVGHSERVCRYSLAIAEELHLDEETKKYLMISSLCHDVGKIGIPDHILKKASFLTHEEYEEMKLHPLIGANIIAHLPHAQKILSGVKSHHERWDGTGYPEGLSGEKIPFFGRIVSVADTFDAMISGRSYSGFIHESDAVERMQQEIELFDPEIVRSLIRAWEHGLISQKTSTVNRKT
ncbi:MAG: HD domain-containing protein [Oligoflexales bacterium]|nr:HD domain-containing protein [Oligoflexales bacterium]